MKRFFGLILFITFMCLFTSVSYAKEPIARDGAALTFLENEEANTCSLSEKENTYVYEPSENGKDNFNSDMQNAVGEESYSSEQSEDADSVSSDGESFYMIFDGVYESFIENADKLFSLFAFIVSLILAFVYKKGLVPLLSGALKNVSGNISEIDRLTKNGAADTKESLKRLECIFMDTRDDISDVSEKLSEYSDKLSKIDKRINENEKIKIAITMQADMLKAIFLSSSLPEYQKSEIVKRVNEIEKSMGTSNTEAIGIKDESINEDKIYTS